MPPPSPAPAAPAPPLDDAGPLDARRRVVSLDVLRGVAVLGILVMNIQSFAMPSAAVADPTRYGDFSGANLMVWLLSHLFFDGKFITLFSMLFGAGLLLTAQRWQETGRRPWVIHLRRMVWLLVIGLAHAYLVWDGDILAIYAVCGVFVFCFRKVSMGVLVGLGVGLMAIPSALYLLAGLAVSVQPQEELIWLNKYWAGDPEMFKTELRAFSGNWLEQMEARVPNAIEMHTVSLAFWAGPYCAGVMLLGMAMYRGGWLSGEAPRRLYRKLVAVALLVGVPMIALGVVYQFSRGFDALVPFFGVQFNYWMAPVVTLGWIGLVMLALKRGLFEGLTQRFAAVGRMALSNYLAQSVVCTFIFYGHGLGLFAAVERTTQVGIVALVWLLQLAWSPWWLSRFRHGPVEWLWRRLTYGMGRRPATMQAEIGERQ